MTAQAEAPHAALAATAALRVHNSAVRWGRGSDASCLELALACTRPWLIPSPLTTFNIGAISRPRPKRPPARFENELGRIAD
jgi:hypothetical protein